MFESETAQSHGEHTLLLDGMHGTFAMSEAEDELWRSSDPANWIWSSDVPHHVTVTTNKVAVLRWDRPKEARVFERSAIERSLDRFYGFLTDDRVRSNRSVVEHLLGFFRRLRSLAHASGLPDARATDVFTASLARLLVEEGADSPQHVGLADDAADLLAKLDQRGFRAALEEVRHGAGTVSWLRLHPSLAIRHAGGQVFQEAHFELLRGATDFDLFGLVGVSEVAPANRGGTHFTPATLARSLIERAISSLSVPLAGRDELTICDPACGSGAFLHEALRALRRTKFEGKLRLIGYDVSFAAISMARFAVNTSLRDWQPKGGVTLELSVADSLAVGMPAADLIVMNPPFIGFAAQSPLQRQQLIDALGTSSAGRGDFSMAFVVKALEALKPGGTLGTLFPASLLSLKASSAWRERLLDLSDLRFLASIGDFGLFSHALVQVAAAVFTKDHSPDRDVLALITENDPQATSMALRQLRRQQGDPSSAPIIEDAWSLFPIAAAALRDRPTWRLPTPSAERVLRAMSQAGFPSVAELFDISQGIQTGLNDALLLTVEEFVALPVKERRFFRRATMTDSIQQGRITRPYWLFFPHGPNGPLFPNEEAVRQAVPIYFARYLVPHEQRLRSRATIVQSRRSDWWGLMRTREWSLHERPRIISKFFGAEGAFVGDFNHSYLAVMGHVWMLKPRSSDALTADTSEKAEMLEETELLAAYVALCNSLPFVKLLSLYSPHVAGGQFDLSARHVGPVPVPDLQLMSLAPETGRAVRELAELGRKVQLPSSEWEQRTNVLTSYLYGGVNFDAI
ncbi:N-6 DNA methylase [Mesorhizobium sp. M2D.F.Ca.ET.223.01.1.1]|uniref:HsdM family class I SAM-dependent methyltransferase n=2 Tax=unclassified Mesorhizobium TaxID=325217 RepID=UPI00142F0534|nr:N-6 DNA methylase [Mesorhizobium sp. M2D.F.Ca.ET.223.01.1.1]